MTRYFFDYQDGADVVRDDIGIECAGGNAVRVQATIALLEMARDYIPGDGPDRDLSIAVRDENGASLCTVSLTFHREDDKLDG